MGPRRAELLDLNCKLEDLPADLGRKDSYVTGLGLDAADQAIIGRPKDRALCSWRDDVPQNLTAEMSISSMSFV